MNSSVMKILKWLGFGISLYQIAIGLFGTPISMVHRPLTIGILMLLLFLTTNKKGEKEIGKIKWYDYHQLTRAHKPERLVLGRSCVLVACITSSSTALLGLGSPSKQAL